MLKKRLRVVTFLTFVLALGLIAVGCTGAAKSEKVEPQYRFRLAEIHPADYPTTKGDQKFADLVYERSKGRIKIDVFPSGQLGDEKAVIEQVQLGAIELARVSTGPVAEFNDKFGVFSLPYIFESKEHLWKFLQGPEGQKMLEDLKNARLRGLAYYDAGARSFYSKKPLTDVSSLRGQKVRVQQNKINIDFMAAFGASATPMAAGEIFSALQTGVIDAAENNFPTYLSHRHYETAKYMILDEHQRIPEVLVISDLTWNKLSAENQKLIKQAALDSVEYQKEEFAKKEKEAEQQLLSADVKITKVTDMQKWKDAVKEVHNKYGSQYRELLQKIEEAK
ncbi:TRAP transporter substrate-binding protein [Paenactinomyces guangxiensis]|uniref:TRAP transporter substrate-binding protein n=1 Tax=Paenactinomyces guangxiensis TaxID=1490290 RepID=A0A7W1WP95_9BACL|nr:TRAP transporter substrate-binding protein [Paenactinomyces guangxiensis]MBA4493569.1 TRAP transporter substrate-binding protein [Paenactinomyces guangxiensis]MBH8590660.1 TRAP transporter substrate-binding protein [Paenactinomyces guangxiensis]